MARKIRADERKFHYIYKITRNDGKFYIGLHSTDNIDDRYFGSGKILKRSIVKHGKNVHIKEIVEFLPSRKALKLRESELVSKELLTNNLCMNLCLGGGGRDSYEMLIETKEKLSIAQKLRTPESRKHTNETKSKISKSNQKPKTIEAIANSVAARNANMCEETRFKLGSGNRGKTQTKESNLKRSETLKLKAAAMTEEEKTIDSARRRESWVKRKLHSKS